MAGKYSKGEELSRFSSNGKTFFFNKFIAKNDSPYLAINALYGQGRQERMVLFEPHWMQFLRHLKASISSLSGLEFKEDMQDMQDVPALKIPLNCHNCGSSSGQWRIMVFTEDGEQAESSLFDLTCNQCSQRVFSSQESSSE